MGVGTLDDALIGARGSYIHRINQTMSAIAEGQIGALTQDGETSAAWQAMAGFRWRF